MKSSGCNSIWQLQDSGNGITCQQCKILIKGSGKYHEENLCYQHIYRVTHIFFITAGSD